ncbi:MAG: bifunctional YncE family protein/alkaline phosphatase family protein [Bryobacteraceae bacterium]
MLKHPVRPWLVPIAGLGMIWFAVAADYSAPAGDRPAQRHAKGPSILPGGRILHPEGNQYQTGPGPFGLAVAPGGRLVASANSGPDRFSITLLETAKDHTRTIRHFVADGPPKGAPADSDDQWRSVFMGLAFGDRGNLFAADGNSGRLRALQPADGATRWVVDLNNAVDGVNFSDSYSGDLAVDSQRGLVHVLDQANFRIVTIDIGKRRIVSSLRLGRLPFSIALAPDRRTAYVTNIGMFEYQALPGANRTQARETGLPFAAFGFPSPESLRGTTAQTASGKPIAVPALGDPNVQESNSLAIVDLADPAKLKLEGFLRTGTAFGQKGSHGGSSPSGVLATDQYVFVSNGHNDAITVIDRAARKIVRQIPIRVPGLEHLRGVLPMGMGYHASSGWLLIAEAGLNAVGVLDTRRMQMIGHIPVGWFPSRVAVEEDDVYVTNVKGNGTGPNLKPVNDDTFVGALRRGSISVFPLPSEAELAKFSSRVLESAGFAPSKPPAALPEQIDHVVIIVKENRTFDEVFGDIREVSNGKVLGFPGLARFGRRGYASGRGDRFSLQRVDVTPNHHKLAETYAFSDNFYADSEVSVDGHHWLVGAYPNAWTESTLRAAYAGQKDFRLPTSAPGRLLFAGSNSSVHPEEQPEAGTLWHHLERHGIPFRNFGEGFELAGVEEGPGLKPTGAGFLTNVPMPNPLFRNTSRQYPGYNMNIPDQYRASQFIQEIETLYRKPGKPLPRLLFLHLPNDHMAKARPEDGYPYEESFVADNDYALGRIVEYLSKSPWWRKMAILVTEDDAAGGRDHIDSHRTLLLAVSPWAKKNYVSHVNSSFPGLLKTAFRILRIPPLNLFDASASDLGDCFTDEPDYRPYTLQPVDARLFVPELARDPLDPKPSPRMDDPAVLREQHRRR